MSLDSLLSQAAADGKLLDAALKNIQSLFAGSDNPVYRASVEELAQAGQWSELNDHVGAQYFRVGEFFIPRAVRGGVNGEPVQVADADKSSFIWQLIHTSRPGALDTSFIATDYLNNPGTMNGVSSTARASTS